MMIAHSEDGLKKKYQGYILAAHMAGKLTRTAELLNYSTTHFVSILLEPHFPNFRVAETFLCPQATNMSFFNYHVCSVSALLCLYNLFWRQEGWIESPHSYCNLLAA